MTSDQTTPVIAAVGEYVERPKELSEAKEPLAMMAEALRAAEADAGAALLDQVQAIHLVGLLSWRYADPVGLLCEDLGVAPAVRENASMGGETPIRLVHDAAVRIARGELEAAAIVGGEALHTLMRARQQAIMPPWRPMASDADAVRFPNSSFVLSETAQLLGVRDPAQIYPFYEMAAQHAWGQTPRQAHEASARLWARFAEVAARTPTAWIRNAPTAERIATFDDGNRMVNWPYPKLMVANPRVNQAAAVIVTSLATAKRLGVPQDKLVFIHGGAAAREPEDYMRRDSYARSSAQEAVLSRALDLTGGRGFDKLELYSCFPIVPKMALRTLGLEASSVEPTVAGGLTFFGGPINNYMSHAVCAMVREVRAAPTALGLLYGQGGYVNKHHALLVGAAPGETPLAQVYSVQAEADAGRGAVPPLDEAHEGAASIETYTVKYSRDGEPVEGIVIVRSGAGARAMASVPAADADTIALLTSWERSAIGVSGSMRRDASGRPVWSAA